ncbi:MAG: GntR family transcriptional regulator [Rhodothermales bacterium]
MPDLLTRIPLRPAASQRPEPLYHQVETDLRRLIDQGVWPPGTTLPPEKQLMDAYGVSRHTMRMALTHLVDAGLIDRRAGIGTVVCEPPDTQSFYLDRSFTRQMADLGLAMRTEVLNAAMGWIETDASPLAAYAGTPAFHLTRLRYGDEQPLALQRTALRAAFCPHIDRYDFAEHSLYAVLSADYNLTIATIDHAVSATTATSRLAETLEVSEGAPLLVVHTTAYLPDDALIEHTVSHYRADRYVYRCRARLTDA